MVDLVEQYKSNYMILLYQNHPLMNESISPTEIS